MLRDAVTGLQSTKMPQRHAGMGCKNKYGHFVNVKTNLHPESGKQGFRSLRTLHECSSAMEEIGSTLLPTVWLRENERLQIIVFRWNLEVAHCPERQSPVPWPTFLPPICREYRTVGLINYG